MPNIDKIVATVLGIVTLGLIIRNADSFNAIMKVGGGLVTENLALLQGQDAGSVAQLRGY